MSKSSYTYKDILYANCPDELDSYAKLKAIFDSVCLIYNYRPDTVIDTMQQEARLRSARRVFTYVGKSCGLTLTEMAAFINSPKERMCIWVSDFESWVLERNDRFEYYLKTVTEVQRRFNKLRMGE